MTLMEQCPRGFQDGDELLAGRHIGEDLSRQVLHALEEETPFSFFLKGLVLVCRLWTNSLHRYHWFPVPPLALSG